MAPSRLRLPRSGRITCSRDFDLVRARGERLSCGVLLVNWLSLPRERAPRLGIVAGRKFGKANARNRVRRLLRESFRLHQHELARPVDLVLVPRPPLAGKGFADVEAHFLSALRQAGLLKEGK